MDNIGGKVYCVAIRLYLQTGDVCLGHKLEVCYWRTTVPLLSPTCRGGEATLIRHTGRVPSSMSYLETVYAGKKQLYYLI